MNFFSFIEPIFCFGVLSGPVLFLVINNTTEAKAKLKVVVPIYSCHQEHAVLQ